MASGHPDFTMAGALYRFPLSYFIDTKKKIMVKLPFATPEEAEKLNRLLQELDAILARRETLERAHGRGKMKGGVYKLRKAPKRDLYWVVGKDGKKYSKEPIPKERAEAQMRALYAAEPKTGGMDSLSLESCEGEAHTGETTLCASEIKEMKDALLDDDVERETVVRSWKVLSKTVSDPADIEIMNEVKSLLSGKAERRKLSRAVNLLITVLDRVFPRSGGKKTGGIIPREVFEARKKSMPGYYPPQLTYEEFARAEGANEEFIQKELGKLKQQNEEYYAAVARGEIEEEVACKLDNNLEYNRDVVSKSVCAARHEARRQKDLTPTQRVFDDINKGLSKVADWAVENVIGELPVVGQVVGEAYKQFAPPTSAYYKPMSEKGVAERIADTGIAVAERRKGKGKDDLVVEGKKAILHPKPLRGKKLREALAAEAIAAPRFIPYGWEAFESLPDEAEMAWQRRKAAIMALPRVGRGKIRSKFQSELKRFGLSPAAYLKAAKAAARKAGLNAESLTFSDNDEHKLMITDDSGRLVRFGRVGYGDFLLWSAAEKKGKVKSGFAAQKQNVFQKSHSQIKGDWKSDKYSPNSLALAVLW
jgi:hypothetical protein